MNYARFARHLAYCFSILLVCIAFAPPDARASATFPTTPDSAWPWIFGNGGAVYSILATEGTVYLGGSFTAIYPYTGSGIPIYTATGSTTAAYPKFNNSPDVSIPDGSGGWYVGGTFTGVDRTSFSYLAHVNADGTIDDDFEATLNSSVKTLALSSDGSTLYLGGNFTSVNGATRNRLAAVSAATGEVADFNPNVGGAVHTIELATSTNTLYTGGAFTTAGGSTRNRLASFSLSDGFLTSWDPNVATGTVQTLSLSPDAGTLYAGGSFGTIGGTLRMNAASFDLSDGSLADWNPAITGSSAVVYAIKATPTTIYVGGTFSTSTASARRNFAAHAVSDGSITSLNPSPNSSVRALALSSDYETLYLGGMFTSFGGTPTITRSHLAALDTSTDTFTSFNANLNSWVYSLSISPDDAQLFAGGIFDYQTTAGITRNRGAAFSTSDWSMTDWNPNFSAQVEALAFSLDSSQIYAGGQFTTVGGTTRNRLAAVSSATGALDTSWNPNPGSFVYSLLLATSTNTLYVGGLFTTATSTTRNRLAAFDMDDGSLTNFNPNADGAVRTLALSPDGGTLYAGGQFTTMGGDSHVSIAKITTADGAVSDWDPGITGTFPYVHSVAVPGDGSTVYLGGQFITVGGITRRGIAALSAADASLGGWNPNTTSVRSLLVSGDGTRLFAGGSFTSATSSDRDGIAEFDLTNEGSLTSWAPDVTSSSWPLYTLAFAPKENALYIGGEFVSAAGFTGSRYFAPYTFATTDVTVPTVSLTAPESGAGVQGTSASLAATASDNVAMERVTFSLDGVPQRVRTYWPFTGTLDTTAFSDGSYTFSAVGEDTYGNRATSSLAIVIDNNAPVLSSIATSSVSGGARITWTTNQPASSKVYFGLSSGYSTSTPERDISPRVTNHSVTLGGLAPCSVYHFQVHSTSTLLHTATSSNATFATGGCGGSAPILATGTSTITTAGGSLTQGRLRLSVPATFTATTSSATFQAHQLEADTFFASAGVPAGKARGGSSVYSLRALVDATTTLSTFIEPLTVTLSYEDSDVSDLDESSLSIYRYDGSDWYPLSSCTVDAGANSVSCTTTAFSDFGIFGDESSDASSGSSGGSVGGGGVIGGPLSFGYQITSPAEAPQAQSGKGAVVVPVFTRTLRRGMSGKDVYELQRYLNAQGFAIAAQGAGSAGKETPYFGSLTHAAVVRFQEAHAEVILAPLGIKKGTGLLGPSTRAFIASLLTVVR